MERTLCQSLILSGLCCLLAGCSAPTVNLATGEPIKVDINMRLDVYQHNSGTNSANAKPEIKSAANVSPEARKLNREADIQSFKSNALVGEGREGLVVVLDKTREQSDEYRSYIRTTVNAENDDRMIMMQSLAETQKASLPEIQARQAEIWRNRAFKGEWIEIPDPEGKTWIWTQKEG